MDMETFKDIAETLATVFGFLLTVSKWLNGNVFSKTGDLVNVLKKVIDFFSGLFGGDGFLAGLFKGDGFSLDSLGLGGIGDFFGSLFG